MEIKNHDFKINKEGSNSLIWFGFELNSTQILILKIFSLIGIFLIPFIFAQDILGIFREIFITLPAYLSEPQHYSEFYLFNNFTFSLSRLIIDGIYLSITIYTFKKIFQNKDLENRNREIAIKNEESVNWLGFRLNHGQSIFIFVISLLGILELPIQCIFLFTDLSFLFWFWKLFLIPTGFNQGSGHIFFDTYFSFIILLIFISMSIYSIITTLRKRKTGRSVEAPKNYILIVFVGSVIMFVVSLFRLIVHLFLFTDLAYMLGTIPESSTPYQMTDFIILIITLILTLFLIVLSYYKRGSLREETEVESNFTWFRKEITPDKALIMLPLMILLAILFGFDLIIGLSFFSILSTNWFFSSEVIVRIPVIIILIIVFYTIGKITMQGRLNKILKSIKERNIECNWFKLKLKNEECLIAFSLGIGFIIYYLNIIVGLILVLISSVLIFIEYFSLILFLQYLITLGFAIGFLYVGIYSVKKTFRIIKSL